MWAYTQAAKRWLCFAVNECFCASDSYISNIAVSLLLELICAVYSVYCSHKNIKSKSPPKCTSHTTQIHWFTCTHARTQTHTLPFQVSQGEWNFEQKWKQGLAMWGKGHTLLQMPTHFCLKYKLVRMHTNEKRWRKRRASRAQTQEDQAAVRSYSTSVHQ